MGIRFILLAAYLVFSVTFLYVLMCGNNKLHRDGLVGRLYRLVVQGIPAGFHAVLERLFPGRCGRTIIGRGGPCRYLILLFYAGLYLVFIGVYTHDVHPHLPRLYSRWIGLHRALTFLVLPWPWLIVLLLQFYDPGEITRENVLSYMALFPYDHVLYEPKYCRTLLVPAVARSRFCRYTERRIAKYDHYCPWVLAPIGLRSHRFFLLFLLANDAAAAYYCAGCWRLLRSRVAAAPVRWAGARWQDICIWFQVAIQLEPRVAGIGFVLVGVVAFMTGFLAQQIWYAGRNVTQVEIDRIEEWREQQQAAGLPAEYIHVYDRGLVRNWIEEWWPPTADRHPPVQPWQPPREEAGGRAACGGAQSEEVASRKNTGRRRKGKGHK
jgi:palmitoyltransferase